MSRESGRNRSVADGLARSDEVGRAMDSERDLGTVTRRRVRVHVIREPGVSMMTLRKREICWNYGIPPREAPRTLVEPTEIDLSPGTIVLISGPSGSGKSSLLAAIAEQAGSAVHVGRRRFQPDRPIVDGIASREEPSAAPEILTACGLGEPRHWIRRYCDLSEGERFRADLARAIGEARRSETRSGGVRDCDARPIICCDEFTSSVHRRLARAVSWNVRKLVSRYGLTLVAAATHEDILGDLQPDRVICLGGGEGKSELGAVRYLRRAISLRRGLVIEPGGIGDYHAFGPMHYRSRDNLGFVDKVFVLREKATGERLGILVYAHAPLELSLRNSATGGRFVRNPRRLNRELRILRRLVMHPDVRGCGLGHWFVRKTLPRAGVRFVECLAAMGEVNPVFEKAGLSRVGTCPLPRGRLRLLERLKLADVDPFSAEFERLVGRHPRVRALVERTVIEWAGGLYGNTRWKTAGRPSEQLAQSFQQIIGRPPVYYLWDKEGEYPVGDTK